VDGPWALTIASLQCAGTGKTALMRDKLRSLDSDAYMSYTINMNSKHDGPNLQPVLEAPLEKKAGEQMCTWWPVCCALVAGALSVCCGKMGAWHTVHPTSVRLPLAASLQACALALLAARS